MVRDLLLRVGRVCFISTEGLCRLWTKVRLGGTCKGYIGGSGGPLRNTLQLSSRAHVGSHDQPLKPGACPR